MLASYISVVLVALFFANAPFYPKSFLPFLSNKSKRWYTVLIEFLLGYIISLLFSLLCESYFSSIYHKDWVFYTVTFCGFLVLSYPGFVIHYLIKRERL
ncbi:MULTISPECIES: DUF2818 family protein [Candidatus Ichthyocystis]|uniref:DUF2818 family protein n=1 Tax=Candidatus Ichthyocystis TaxID=2929841 RepID=UPI000B8509BE|nr:MULTISPECIES: DUF2818 family protein [Ichthyocystis]